MCRNTPLHPRVIPFCQRDHVKRSLSPALFGIVAFVTELIGVYSNCSLVVNTSNGLRIGLNTSDITGVCAEYGRGYLYDIQLFIAKVMSGVSLSIGGFALLMTIVSQLLWAGLFFWRCLAFWMLISGLLAGMIFVVHMSPLCYDAHGIGACDLLPGGQLICIGAGCWCLAGIFGMVFPPPDVPDPDRPVTTMGNGNDVMTEHMNIDKQGDPFTGVSY